MSSAQQKVIELAPMGRSEWEASGAVVDQVIKSAFRLPIV